MKKIDELYSKLTETKEELNKNTNMSYGASSPNQAGAAPPAASNLAQGEQPQKVNLNNPYNETSRGSIDSKGRENSDQNDKAPELKKPKGVEHREQPSIKKGEVCKIDKNGQWNLQKDAADPKLAPKEVKIKKLQQQIDSGTYKPDASKIADKILKQNEKPKQELTAKDIRDQMAQVRGVGQIRGSNPSEKPSLLKEEKPSLQNRVSDALFHAEDKEGQIPTDQYNDPKYMKQRSKDIKAGAVKQHVKENLDQSKKSLDEVSDLIKGYIDESELEEMIGEYLGKASYEDTGPSLYDHKNVFRHGAHEYEKLDGDPTGNKYRKIISHNDYDYVEHPDKIKELDAAHAAHVAAKKPPIV